MAIGINDNFDIRAPKLTDKRSGPFSSVETALASINVNTRANGLSVIIGTGEDQEEYWFKNGNLVPKNISGGGSFAIINVGEDDTVNLQNHDIQKVTLTQPQTYINGMTAPPGSSGFLVLKQDDEASRLFYLTGNGNIGSLGSAGTNNVLPRAVTTLHWYRDDEYCYWKIQDVVKGIYPTIKPVFRVDDLENTLTLYHELPSTELLISENDGPWLPYEGVIQVGPVDRPAGYWKAKVKDHPSRTTSPIAYSLPFHAETLGFPYTFNFELS